MNRPNNTILLISYHFHPSIEIGGRRVTALAKFLAARGTRVIVVSEFGSKLPATGSEIWPNVIAIPVARPCRLILDTFVSFMQKASLSTTVRVNNQTHSSQPEALPLKARIYKALRELFFRIAYFIDPYKKWSWRAAQAAICAGKEYKAQLVLSSGPPHTMLLAGTWIGQRLNIPHVADLRDPWTDNVSVFPASNALETKLLRALERWVVQRAAAITSTGATVAELLSKRYPDIRKKVQVIRNGFDGAVNTLSTRTENRLSILFAGELYVKRNPFPLLTALENLLSRDDVDAQRVELTFMGRCDSYNGQPLADWLHGKRCETAVKIFPQMPQNAVSEATSKATVLLNLAQQQPLSVPAKTFEHLASGREILLICENDSETAQLVAGISGVLQVDQSNAGALDRALRDLYQRHVVEGRLNAPQSEQVFQFSRDAANQRFLELMQSLTERRHARVEAAPLA